MTRFTLTADHIKLLRHMYVGWQDCETGAPEIDPKRPYGNSDVAGDVAEILGWKRDADGDLCDADVAKARKLHGETSYALKIILVTGKFEPGEYEKAELYDDRSWRKV